MAETVHIENVVLGGGEAGNYVASDLAQQGRSVVVIERALIGGSCPNVACLPSKNVIAIHRSHYFWTALELRVLTPMGAWTMS